MLLSSFYNFWKSLKNHLKTLKNCNNFLFFSFCITIGIEKLTLKNDQTKSLNRILGVVSSPWDLENKFKKQKWENEKEMMKKKRLLTRYDLSINYFHEPIIKTVDISKDKIFERDKDYCKDLCKKNWENN